MATQLANRPAADPAQNALVAFNGQLQTRADQFKMVLPSHITPEKFQRTVMTAVQADIDLLRADRQSLLLACMKAAQDGLLPDKREAALVIFKTNQKVNGEWVQTKQVQYMPMVYGLRKKILQSGEIADITAKVVYRREVEEGLFIYEEGTEAMLRHRPLLDGYADDFTDDKIVLAYSMATFKDGGKSYEIMRRFEIDKVRECSQTGATRDRWGKERTPSGPWVDWFPEQAKKTVMRRHSKTLPMSGDILDIEHNDDTLYAASATAALDMAQPDAPAQITAPGREQLLEQAQEREGTPAHDPETGEISEDVERELDRQAFAQADGRAVDDDDDNDDEAVGSAAQVEEEMAVKSPLASLLDAIEDARTAKQLREADAEFVRIRASLSEEHVMIVEDALSSARRAISSAAKEG
jgi:recombination protein RecT